MQTLNTKVFFNLVMLKCLSAVSVMCAADVDEQLDEMKFIVAWKQLSFSRRDCATSQQQILSCLCLCTLKKVISVSKLEFHSEKRYKE